MSFRLFACVLVLLTAFSVVAQDQATLAVRDDQATTQASSDQAGSALAAAIAKAGVNASQIQAALDKTPTEQRAAMEFLIANMPPRDLRTLSAEFLLNNVDVAYRTWKDSKWEVPHDIFLNNILPHASINETRDDFRANFRDQFAALVKDAKSPGEAATILNRQIFKKLNVKYSRKRRRADQGPFESIESGLASCTGLSVLLIDACRSVGVPARFVGTPLWADKSGNHSWIEVWDDGWHFTGAAEPTGDELDKGWFVQRSSLAERDSKQHAIYAVSYKKTPITFPLVWDRSIDYVHAINVTDRYAGKHQDLPVDHTYAMFQVCGQGGQRQSNRITIRDNAGNILFEGNTKDERFDGNDHTTVVLPLGKSFDVEWANGRKEKIETKPTPVEKQLFTFVAADALRQDETKPEALDANAALKALEAFAADANRPWEELASAPFAQTPLSKEVAAKAKDILVAKRKQQLMAARKAEVDQREIVLGDHKLPFFYKVYGDKPAGGRSLFISMHGGGNAPANVNDRQWNNQKKLYVPAEGVYVAPRAPTNTWNLWHESHIMGMFDRLIEDMVLLEDVDPNRVYVMGYSAGGDGVYQLAPRMADRWAAAAMMAGHPNDAKPQNLRNIGFALYMGGKDAAYKRNEVAKQWGEKLSALQASDPTGYQHLVTIYPEKGHWMDGEDKSAVPWMSKFNRTVVPTKVVWRKDGNPQPRFYWLGADPEAFPQTWQSGAEVTVERAGQTFRILNRNEKTKRVTLLLNDAVADLDQPIHLVLEKSSSAKSTVQPVRTIAAMHRSLSERFDPSFVYDAVVTIDLD